MVCALAGQAVGVARTIAVAARHMAHPRPRYLRMRSLPARCEAGVLRKLLHVHHQVIGEPAVSGLEELGFGIRAVAMQANPVREWLEAHDLGVGDATAFTRAG